jgi:hypothetical protein
VLALLRHPCVRRLIALVATALARCVLALLVRLARAAVRAVVSAFTPAARGDPSFAAESAEATHRATASTDGVADNQGAPPAVVSTSPRHMTALLLSVLKWVLALLCRMIRFTFTLSDDMALVREQGVILWAARALSSRILTLFGCDPLPPLPRRPATAHPEPVVLDAETAAEKERVNTFVGLVMPTALLWGPKAGAVMCVLFLVWPSKKPTVSTPEPVVHDTHDTDASVPAAHVPEGQATRPGAVVMGLLRLVVRIARYFA